MRGDFETHMKELAEVRIIAGVRLDVTKRIGKLRAGPSVDFLSSGEVRVVDVDDVEVPLLRR